VDTNILKLSLLSSAFLFLGTMAFILNRPFAWKRPLLGFGVPFIIIAVHYLIVGYSIAAANTFALLNGLALLAVAATGSSALSPEAFLTFLRRLAIILTYPMLLYLLALHLGGQGYDEVGNFIGFTENSNMMGGYLALFMFPAVAQNFLMAPRLRAKIIPLLASMVLLFLIYSTASRAALLSIICGLAFVSFFSKALPRRIRLLIILGVLASPLFLTTFIQKYEDLSIFSSRLFLYILRFEAISSSPWVGWGLAADVNNTYNEHNIFPPQEKGNTILQLMEEFGIPLGTLFTLAITLVIVSTGRRLSKLRSMVWVPLFLVAAWVHSMFETWMFNFHSLLAIFFWLTLIVATFHARSLKLPRRTPENSGAATI
jgi:O-antigen ligase